MGREVCRQAGRQGGMQTGRQTGRYADRQADREVCRQASRQAGFDCTLTGVPADKKTNKPKPHKLICSIMFSTQCGG